MPSSPSSDARDARPAQRRTGSGPSPSSTGQQRPVRPSDTGQQRPVRPSDTGQQRATRPSDTGQQRATRPSDTGRQRAVSDTGARRRVSNTGSMRSPSSTGSQRPLGDTGRQRSLENTGSRRRVSNTGAHRPVRPSDTGTHRALRPSDTGQYVDASLDGTTSSLGTVDTRRRRVRGASGARNGRNAAPRPRHAAPGAHAAHSQKRFPTWGIVAVIALVVALGVGGFFVIHGIVSPYEGARVADGETVTVVIPDGSSGTAIIDTLLDAGVIHNRRAFRKAVANQNADQSLRSGTYTFVTGSDPEEVVRQLVAGPNSAEGQLLVPEGLTIKQTASVVESSLGIPADDFLAQAKAANYVADYPFLEEAGEDSLEGFLYPKTYDFAGQDVSADSVIRLMLTQYQTEIDKLDMDAAREALAKRYNLNVTNYDMLKMASIIEKEAVNEDDRPKVASVFYNRLSAGMALQSDATMGYVTDGAPTTEDLQKDSPYNTYYYKGLPPTPICSPSEWALDAAMHPADTDYLFFFIIDNDYYSNHTFTETYEEHDAAYAEALKEQEAAAAEANKADAADDKTSEAKAGEN